MKTNYQFKTVSYKHLTKIANAIDLVYHTTLDELIQRNRQYRFIEPRALLMYILYTKYLVSYKRIGEMLDRDHSTVRTAVHKMHKLLGNNNE